MTEGEFAQLLRRHRLERQLTQEALAERAGISARSAGELERGRGRAARPDTVVRLAAALDLTGSECAAFVAAGQSSFWHSRAGRRFTAPTESPDGTLARQLPPDLTDFVGRTGELAYVCGRLRPPIAGAGLVVVSGPAGVGKSALAIRAGHLLAPHYPDGQFYARLTGASPDPADPAEVLAELLRVLGIHGAALPAGPAARAALFRDRLAGRAVLLVLDDAGGYRQVEHLMPGNGAAVIVTSRAPLTALPGAINRDLRPLPDATAVELLGRVAGPDRVGAEPAAARTLVAACGGLPLAVRIAGARLAARPHWTVGDLARRLTDQRSALDELRHADLAVRPGLQLTYRGLTRRAATAFGRLGRLPVPSLPDWMVAPVLDVPAAEGLAALEELVDARLVEELGRDPVGQYRYRFHDLTRLYARERSADHTSPGEWTAVLTRAAMEALALARHAQDRLVGEHYHLDDRAALPARADERATAVAARDPVAWFEAERVTLSALVTACADADLAGPARALAGCAADFYEHRGYYDDWRRTTEAALAACRRSGDEAGETALLRGLGTCLIELASPASALDTLRAAHAKANRRGDAAAAALAGRELGFALAVSGNLEEAERVLRTAVSELDRTHQPPAMALAMTSLGFVYRQRGELTRALSTVRAAFTVARGCGDRFAQAYASRGLAGALLDADRPRAAEHAARRAMRLYRRIGNPIAAAQSQRTLGEALAKDPRRLAEAEAELATALSVFRRHGYEWGSALVELTLGEVEARHGVASAAARLTRALEYWTAEDVPILQARTLVALAEIGERCGDPATGNLLERAHQIFRRLNAPQADALAARLATVRASGCYPASHATR